MTLLQDIIDIIRGKKELKLVETQSAKLKNARKNISNKIKEKISNNEKIKVGFLCVHDNAFQYSKIYEKMLNDELFEPFILVIPDIVRGDDFMYSSLNKTFETLSNKYQNVYLSLNKDTNDFIDFSDKIDIAFFCNPYDGMTHSYYRIDTLSLCAFTYHVPYAFFVTSYLKTFLKRTRSLTYLNKIFIETKENEKHYIKKGFNPKNINVTGYPRVDDLAQIEKVKRDRKKVIIAPHSVSKAHTTGIEFAEFLNFYKDLIELPKKYPQIDFLFRPHPFLFLNLEKEEIWTKEEVENYINTMKNYPNVTYQNGGDFAFDFVNSDGIIHDCGSFLPEYLITGNPTCYMQTSKETYKKYFISTGQKCLDNCYIADKPQKIYDFIDNVILAENDPMKEKRTKFVEENLKLNYGKVSEVIIQNIKNELLGVN